MILQAMLFHSVILLLSYAGHKFSYAGLNLRPHRPRVAGNSLEFSTNVKGIGSTGDSDDRLCLYNAWLCDRSRPL